MRRDKGGIKIVKYLLGVCGLLIMLSCEKIEMNTSSEACDDQIVCDVLNDNISFLAALATVYESEGVVTAIKATSSPCLGMMQTVMFENDNTETFSHVCQQCDTLPLVSMSFAGDVLCWTLNGECMTDSSGNVIPVMGDTNRPHFSLSDTGLVLWCGSCVWPHPYRKAGNGGKQNVYFSPDGDFMVCNISDSLQMIVPTDIFSSTLRHGVPLQGFYKDVFMDAGVYLTTRNTLAAATYLGYSLESISCTSVSDTAWQNTVIGGCEEDLNGRLLYPDGAPRYRMLFVCGGKATKHGSSLREECRERMQEFVRNGGSYVGTCAGAFFATSQRDMYLHIWPGQAKQTGLSGSHTGMFVDEGSPLLRYYDFGGDNYVANIRHNGGCYALDWPTGTELLARFDYPQLEMHGKPSAWAYKKNITTGRVIMEGSHPEEVSSGERRDFTAAMLRYAVDGVGETTIKGLLRNGEPRTMDKSTNEDNPEYTMIGDLQYHHFVVYIPQGAQNIQFVLDSKLECDMQLTLSRDNYAYIDDAQYASPTTGASQELFFDNLTSGLWYVAVRCLTTVTASDVPLGQEYSGRTDVLNGVPYTISVTWNNK